MLDCLVPCLLPCFFLGRAGRGSGHERNWLCGYPTLRYGGIYWHGLAVYAMSLNVTYSTSVSAQIRIESLKKMRMTSYMRVLSRSLRPLLNAGSINSRNSSSAQSNEQPDDELDKLAEKLDSDSKKVKTNPEKTTALLFPGQGSQYVGMAKNLLQYPNVKEMFDAASELLGYNLLNLCLVGPKTELDKTIHCQPAVVVTSLASIERLQAESPEVLENCLITAGFSVGEYAALVFSGALSFEDAIRLVKVRASEMQKASDDVGSGMISVIGGARTRFNLACTEAVDYCQDTLGMEYVVCKVSGYLAPNVRTIAGHRAALEYLLGHEKNYYIKRAQILPVSGAFHSVLMQPARKKLKTALGSVNVQTPIIKVYSNIDGKPYQDASDIVKKLPDQIVRPVLWEQSMHNIFTGTRKTDMPCLFELAPGRQLGALLRSCNGKAWGNYMPVDSKDPHS